MWFDVNTSSRPSRVSLPFGLSIDRPQARDNAAILRMLDALPPDPRAEREQVRHLFGEGGWSGEELSLPADAGDVFGTSHSLYVTMRWTGFTFARPAGVGGWRFVGVSTPWFVTADETHFYRNGDDGGTSRGGSTSRRPGGCRWCARGVAG